MSRHRQQRRVEKARRHTPPSWAAEPSWPTEPPPVPSPQKVVARESREVVRLAYTRTQAAQALGISRSTLRRLLPYLETIELPWGTTLIPVDELERLVDEQRRAARSPTARAVRGRPPRLAPDIVERIRAERAAGKSLRQIAADLNAAGTPTAHAGKRWWPSTVRAVLLRA
jgi:hypothetical protein